MTYPRSGCLLAGIALIAFGGRLPAETPPVKKAESTKFVRLQRDAQQQPLKLETAIVRFGPAAGQTGPTVDLVGAVHVADRDYYDALNKQLEKYDVVLYELVAPPGTRIPKGGKKADNPLAFVQQIMKFVLDLDLQTERIDYTKSNFVHADMSPEQMAKAMKNRGEDGLTLFLSIAADVLKQQNLQQAGGNNGAANGKDLDLASLFLDPEGPVKLKQIMAGQMEAFSSPEGGLGRTLKTILISDRNKAALKVLESEIAKGHKKIAIFYGAAHMPDFEKRLHKDFGLERKSQQWLTAWDIRVKEKGLDDLLDLLKLLDR